MALAAWVLREVPEVVPIGNLDQVEVGALVTVRGTVERVGGSGSDVTVITLSDGDGSEVDAFCGFPCDAVLPGARVQATGRVSVYRGRLEVVVEEGEDLVVLGSVRSPMVDVEDLVREPWAFEGMEPRVRVMVLVDPVVDLNGEDWWCLVGDDASDGAGALALVGPGIGVETWTYGDRLDLRVVVRYDGSSGFIYLEVLEAA